MTGFRLQGEVVGRTKPSFEGMVVVACKIENDHVVPNRNQSAA